MSTAGAHTSGSGTAPQVLDLSISSRVPFARLVKVELRKMLDTRGGTLMSEQVQSDLLLRATGRVG